MSGIGDQTFDFAKGLEALPNDVTIDIIKSSLKITFVKFCKPLKIKNPQYVWGLYAGGYKTLDRGKPSTRSSQSG